MFRYEIYDENNELMRKTKTLVQAKELCKIRNGWYYKKIEVKNV